MTKKKPRSKGFQGYVERLEEDAVALDDFLREPNPLDALAASLEAGEDREDLL